MKKMESLKNKFVEKALPRVADYRKLMTDHAGMEIGTVTIGSVLSGMKGVVSLLTDTSKLDPEDGIRFRGYSIPELRQLLPKANPQGEPLPEGIFYLMLMGQLPSDEDVADLSREWAQRSDLPEYVYRVLDSMPIDARPMAQFSAAILSMAADSKFYGAYMSGVTKKDYWDSTYEDIMDLIARIPVSLRTFTGEPTITTNRLNRINRSTGLQTLPI
jgi:citrate synthase